MDETTATSINALILRRAAEDDATVAAMNRKWRALSKALAPIFATVSDTAMPNCGSVSSSTTRPLAFLFELGMSDSQARFDTRVQLGG